MRKGGVAIGLLVGILIALLGRLGAFAPFADVAYQSLFNLRGSQIGSPDIVLLNIDQDSIDRFGKFPWPRSRYAELVARLDEMGATAIGFGFSFNGETPDDETFARACRQSGNVYLPVRTSYTEGGLEFVPPPASIRNAAAGLGHIFLASSSEDSVGFIPLDRGTSSEGYFALALLLALSELGIETSEILPFREPYYQIGPLRVPVGSQREMRINYVGADQSFADLSYAEAFADDWRERMKEVDGRLVLVDVTAPGHMAEYPIPAQIAGQTMVDALIHANALDTLLRQRFIWVLMIPWWVFPLLLGILGHWWSSLPGKWSLPSGLASIAGFLVLSPLLFINGNMFFDPTQIATGLGATLAAVSAWRLWQRERWLRAYAPASLARDTQTNGAIPEGQQMILVILFADIKSYTALAESGDPQAVYRVMKQCIQILVDQVHNAEGMIDKFTGDGIMALYGLPESRADDAERAVRAALHMQAALASFDQAHIAEMETPLQLRIGINIGPVIVGSVGSDLRKDFTVMGDAVNVAARLEQSAEPGTVSVSAAIQEATSDRFSFAPLGPLQLRNRAQPVRAYRVEGFAEK